jgi:hypothetical protein
MNCPTTQEIRNLKAKGTALARRAAAQANSIRDHAFRTAFHIVDVVDKRTGEIIDAYPMSKEFFYFVVRERAAKTLGVRSETLTTEQATSLLREHARKELARRNETPEQKVARQAEEIYEEQKAEAYRTKQTLWS